MFKKFLKSCGVVASLVCANIAMADTIVVSSPSFTDLLPSSDKLTLNAVNLNTTIGNAPAVIAFQTGNFFVDVTSTSLNGTYSYLVNQDVTINSITQTVAFNFVNEVTSTADTLTFGSGSVVQFGNVSFQALGFSVTATSVGDHSFTMQAQVSAVPEPETYAMMLAGLGLMGAVARRRKTKQLA